MAIIILISFVHLLITANLLHSIHFQHSFVFDKSIFILRPGDTTDKKYNNSNEHNQQQYNSTQSRSHNDTNIDIVAATVLNVGSSFNLRASLLLCACIAYSLNCIKQYCNYIYYYCYSVLVLLCFEGKIIDNVQL